MELLHLCVDGHLHYSLPFGCYESRFSEHYYTSLWLCIFILFDTIIENRIKFYGIDLFNLSIGPDFFQADYKHSPPPPVR